MTSRHGRRTEAAADHAAAILGPSGTGGGGIAVVTGGDRAAVGRVLADRRLEEVHVLPPWVPAAELRRRALEDAVATACALVVVVTNR